MIMNLFSILLCLNKDKFIKKSKFILSFKYLEFNISLYNDFIIYKE